MFGSFLDLFGALGAIRLKSVLKNQGGWCLCESSYFLNSFWVCLGSFGFSGTINFKNFRSLANQRPKIRDCLYQILMTFNIWSFLGGFDLIIAIKNGTLKNISNFLIFFNFPYFYVVTIILLKKTTFLCHFLGVFMPHTLFLLT